MNWKDTYHHIIGDENYLRNLDWGRPRRGHPEGTVRAHIEHLEENLGVLCQPETDEFWKLRILVHVHDTFKAEASKGVAITDPRSHASLARRFLSSYCRDPDLLNMVQYHDEPFALWRQQHHRGHCNPQRLAALRGRVKDWPLFLKFLLVDGFTPGKDPAPLEWAIRTLAEPHGLGAAVKNALKRLRSNRSLSRV